jgi:PKD repeat protein
MEFIGSSFLRRFGRLTAAARRLGRFAGIGGLAVFLAACGGGGGSSDGSNGGGTNNVSPTASFTVTPSSGKAPLPVTFNGSASTDPDGSIATYLWDFGDSTTGSGATTQHTYTSVGTFMARLTVTDNKGATGTTTRSVTVQPQTGSVAVNVKDANGLSIPGATVVVSVGGQSRSGPVTDASGNSLVADVPVGTGTVSVTRETFLPKSQSVTVTADQVSNVALVLERITKAVGGVLTTSQPLANLVSGSELEFAIQVVVVDEFSNAVDGLTASAFTLNACVPDPNTTAADCVVGAAGEASFDSAYTVLGPGSSPGFLPSFERVPGTIDPEPYAATLMFDQSRTIIQNDPTDARLFSAKEFLKNLGAGDSVALAAFATNIQTSNGTALIPVIPVTIYPPANPAFTSDGTSLFPTLDSLANLEGGGTPLYEAICQVMDFSKAKAPVGPRQAAVVFTDGKNEPGTNVPNCPKIEDVLDKRASMAEPKVDIFTVGLSGDVDGEALARLASEGGGTFLFAEDTTQLITIYGSLGSLLSGRLTTYRLTYRIKSSAVDAFQTDRRVLGSLTVDTGAAIVNLPFIVRIF